jgi:hypothetical protein
MHNPMLGLRKQPNLNNILCILDTHLVQIWNQDLKKQFYSKYCELNCELKKCDLLYHMIDIGETSRPIRHQTILFYYIYFYSAYFITEILRRSRQN